ncbi:MAG: type I-E CRISPR-associated endonuclease Cas1 [bacterium]|nr:type I-E CRISPR-associated endonuclease Cas1 [bacterium]
MRIKDLHELPKVRDRLSYLYVEHCRIEQEAKAIAIYNEDGVTPVPCASLTVLMVGPGTAITHAAVLALADNGCLVVWCGEQGVRFYAAGQGTTRSAANLLRQASLATRTSTRLQVTRRLYAMRFNEVLDASLTLQQIRGMEGVRVREAYARCSAEAGVQWNGRNYDRGNWRNADPVNRALSAANSCLYGLCHAAIVAAGYSPALGFIHTGKQLSFAYDVADLYKVEMTIPAAFQAAAIQQGLESEVRKQCRDVFAEKHLLKRVVKDIDYALQVPLADEDDDVDYDADPAAPGGLWDPNEGTVSGGTSYAPEDDAAEEGA